MSSGISPDEAQTLLTDWVASPSLRRHCLAVCTAMRAYAENGGHDEDLWAITGLLHDADYERFPDPEDTVHGHPRTIMAELSRRDAPPEMIRAIAAHADYLGVEPETPLERTIVAVDELCGFLVACAQVRPGGIVGMTPKSVKKKLKQPSFAAAVNRDDVRDGAARLDVGFDEHIAFVIEALQARADDLGLSGTTVPHG